MANTTTTTSTNNKKSSPIIMDNGVDIGQVLRDEGPIVTCVVLKADDATATIEEIQMDTTPKKSSVEQILGGGWTFVGQYEEEGIVLMAAAGRQGCCSVLDKEQEHRPSGLPRNRHQLQPPLDKAQIYGDILVVKVAAANTDEEEEQVVVSNDEFFLDYTKKEYMAFAARTDVQAPERPAAKGEDEEEEEEDDVDEDDDEEDDWSEGEDDDDEISEEEAQGAMMQLLMTNVLRQFRENHGRGPDTEELLALKSAIAQKLGIVTEIKQQQQQSDNEEEEEEEDGKEGDGKESEKSVESDQAKKRGVEEATKTTEEESEPQQKKVKYGDDETKPEDALEVAQ